MVRMWREARKLSICMGSAVARVFGELRLKSESLFPSIAQHFENLFYCLGMERGKRFIKSSSILAHFSVVFVLELCGKPRMLLIIFWPSKRSNIKTKNIGIK